jgi:hypothetical protein
MVEELGWTTDGDETALICGLADGSAGWLPARWTDLPWRVAPEVVGGAVASLTGWRALIERAEELGQRRPRRRGDSGANGGGDVGTAGASDRNRKRFVAAAVWQTLPVERRLEVTVRLARLLARLVEVERNE